MSMFNFKSGQSAGVDLSTELLDVGDLTPERLLTLEYAHDITDQAFDPLTGLLATGRPLWPRPLVPPNVDLLLSPARTLPFHQELA